MKHDYTRELDELLVEEANGEHFDTHVCPNCDHEYHMVAASWTADGESICPMCGHVAGDLGEWYA